MPYADKAKQRAYMIRRRRKIKVASVEYMGGKCQRCGYDKSVWAMAFHHLDPDTKEFGMSDGAIRSWGRIQAELDKCILVCHNCHAEIHEEIHSEVADRQST